MRFLSSSIRLAAVHQVLLLPMLLNNMLSVVSAEATATTDPAATASPTQAGWSGCVNPDDPTALVTIGKPTTVCLVLANGADWSEERTYMRLHFLPIADQYSRFRVPKSFEQLIAANTLTQFDGTNITVHAESQQQLSFQRLYFFTKTKVYPYLTAIIDVNRGVVQGITWDNACVFCSKNECEPNMYDFAGNNGTQKEFQQPIGSCYVDLATCTKWNSEGRDDCDLLLYTVWTGTDSQGNSFLSSAYRFSAFPAQALSDRFSQYVPDIKVPQGLTDIVNGDIMGGGDKGSSAAPTPAPAA